MTTLIIDGLIAALKLTDRGMTAVENVFRVQSSPRTVDGGTRLAGAGAASAAAGPGEHPTTSELLTAAVCQLSWAFDRDKRPAVIAELLPALRLRAAEFKAIGD